MLEVVGDAAEEAEDVAGAEAGLAADLDPLEEAAAGVSLAEDRPFFSVEAADGSAVSAFFFWAALVFLVDFSIIA